MDKTKISFAFALLFIVLGLIFSFLNIGSKEFLGFSSLGGYFIYIGIISLLIVIVKKVTNKKRKVDERMIQIALQSSRISFVLIILAAFIINACAILNILAIAAFNLRLLRGACIFRFNLNCCLITAKAKQKKCKNH